MLIFLNANTVTTQLALWLQREFQVPLGRPYGAKYGAQQTICDMGELIENEGVTLGDTTKPSRVITQCFSKTAPHFRHELV